MPKLTLLVQISDLHIGANENGVDPIPRLEAAIEAIRSLPNAVDAALVSGDLTDDGGEGRYRLARELLERLAVPLHVLPGNHDDRHRLREAFDLPDPPRGAPLAEVVARHPQLRAIVGGHLHRVAASTLAGCPVLSAPSTYLQAQPDFETEKVELGGVPGLALHALRDGELSSQVESVLF